MTLAWISLFALLSAVVLSFTSRVNVGVVAITLAWLIGVYIAPQFLEDLQGKSVEVLAKWVMAGFPASLFLTLVGVTLLFMLAEANGTLVRVAHRAVRLCRGNVGMIPIMFFALTAALSTIGVGSIAATALVAPMAMMVADRARIPPLLMVILVGHGGVAGGLSPFALTGIVVREQMEKIGFVGYEWRTYWLNVLANALVAVGAYLLFGGWRLFARNESEKTPSDLHDTQTDPIEIAGQSVQPQGERPFEWRHGVTLAVIAGLIVAVVGLQADVGLAGFCGAAILVALRIGDERTAFRNVPWNVILMVCGVSMLVSLVEQTGGMELFTSLLAQVSSPDVAAGMMAFVTGAISVFSSTSGVVLPTFLPMVPGLVENLGGGEPLSIAMAINIGSGLVDVSPVSTIGALCLAASPNPDARERLFMPLLAWGLSMSLVGAVLCHLLFVVLW